MYIVVEFVEASKPHLAAVREALVLLSRSILDKKLGCLLFEVGQDEVDSSSFLVYQVYTSKASYTAHVEMTEYAEHRQMCDRWTTSRRHLSYDLISGTGHA